MIVTCASYERVSTRRQDQFGFSLGAQHQTLEEFVAAHEGWTLPEHFRFRDGDREDASGAAWDLPGLTAMLEAAKRREFEVLVVYDLDRFARSLTKALVLEDQLKKCGVRVVYLRVPTDDTPEGRMLKHQLFSYAEYEREKFALRSVLGRRQKAGMGMVVGGGRPPYGYRFAYQELVNRRRPVGLEEDPITGPLARRLLRLLPTRSTAEVADELNRDGVPGPNGKPWTPKAIQYIANNPVYAGTWVWNRFGHQDDEEGAVHVPVPALITRQEWDEIQRALASRRCRRGSTPARRGQVPREKDPYLLRGLLACGHCHGGLKSRDNNGVRYYRCDRSLPSHQRFYGGELCTLPDVNAAELETVLRRVVAAALFDPDNLARMLKRVVEGDQEADRLWHDRRAAFDRELARQRRRLDGLTARLADVEDDEVYASIMRQAKEIGNLIGRLEAERSGLVSSRPPLLTAEGMDEIMSFAMNLGYALSQPGAWRRTYEQLRVRGRVFAATPGEPGAIKLGRKHRFRVEWSGLLLSGHPELSSNEP